MKLIQKIFLWYYSTKFKIIASVSPSAAANSAFDLFCTPYSKRKVGDAPAAFMTAEKYSFDFQQHHIHGFGWRPATANGHKVLICHGFDSMSYRFERYIKPLLDKGFELYAFDAPAHGLSSGKRINALLYRDMILEIIAMYGPFDCLLSHSFGGIATALAVEKMKYNLPKQLIFIAPATETTRSLNDFCRHLKIGPAIRTELEKLIEKVGGQPVEWYSVARIIQSISIPTLWIHDKKDRITPFDDMKHLLQLNLPTVEFVITDGLGHSLYRDDEVADLIIKFLEIPAGEKAIKIVGENE